MGPFCATAADQHDDVLPRCLPRRAEAHLVREPEQTGRPRAGNIRTEAGQERAAAGAADADAHPPLSHMPHGTSVRSPAAAVSEPFWFSTAQKKRVLLGMPGLLTPMLPAKLRGSVQFTPGIASVTSKSAQEAK